MPFTLPHELPPLRLFLVWDNLAGHKTPDLVLWLCAHGIMPLDTPVGGSWLVKGRGGVTSAMSEAVAQVRQGRGPVAPAPQPTLRTVPSPWLES